MNGSPKQSVHPVRPIVLTVVNTTGSSPYIAWLKPGSERKLPERLDDAVDFELLPQGVGASLCYYTLQEASKVGIRHLGLEHVEISDYRVTARVSMIGDRNRCAELLHTAIRQNGYQVAKPPIPGR